MSTRTQISLTQIITQVKSVNGALHAKSNTTFLILTNRYEFIVKCPKHDERKNSEFCILPEVGGSAKASQTTSTP